MFSTGGHLKPPIQIPSDHSAAGYLLFCIKRELLEHLDPEVFMGEQVGLQWRLVFSDSVSGLKVEIPAFGTVPNLEDV